MAKKTVIEKKKKEVKPFTVEKQADGFSKVIVTNGVEFWPPTGAKEGISIEGTYVETLEYKNNLDKDGSKPLQYKPIIKTVEGKQVALPENWAIAQAIAQFGVKFYRVTFDGQRKGTGEHKGKKFNNYTIEFMDKAPSVKRKK